METLYYVPEDEDVEPHLKEAELWQLQIVHGIPPKILKKHPDITPSKAGIMKIPVISNGIELLNHEVKTGLHQSLIFVNEFEDIREKMTISVYNTRSEKMVCENLKPQWCEKHRARWKVWVANIGTHQVSFLKEGEKVSDTEFIAYKR